jgi:hypothetical protein
VLVSNNYRSTGVAVTCNSALEGGPPRARGIQETIIAALADNLPESTPNPSEILLLEATQLLFGHHRRVGCFVSIGANPTLPQVEKLSSAAGIGKMHIDKYTSIGVNVQFIHEKIQRMVVPDEYFRFDINQDVELDQEAFTEMYILGHSNWRCMYKTIDRTNAYLKQDAQRNRIASCARKLYSSAPWPRITAQDADLDDDEG